MAILICFGLPAVIAVCTFIFSYLGLNSTKWPSVKGKLVKYEIIDVPHNPKFPSLQTDTFVRVELVYEYVVKNKKYTSNRLSFQNNKYRETTQIGSDQLLTSIKNNNFTVYYFDKFPRFSVLETGYEYFAADVGAIVGVLFFGALIYFLYKFAWPYLTLPPPKYSR